ncbi:MAG: Periplasmic serine proteinase [Candidatus Moranbacteria bacterium GW2011_GWD2_36_12]|nr:MAG: Periplasmic serine proteinase [Candidatus Moranbacteria bacterium GW2011_GWD2_36_12]KKQ06697.1 MAG: Periplasmic serine proteinase [Candidatus Moranbacteria bacterium GW2011_GWE2_36_40]
MKNRCKIFLSAFMLMFAIASFVFCVEKVKAADEQKFTQEELVSLSKPSVVRIVKHIQGEAIFKPFSLDLDKLTIIEGGGEKKKIPIDEYMNGSGFVVSNDGYILTNSHVISNQQIKLEIVASVAQAAIMDATLFSLDVNQETTEPEKFEEYGKKINDYLMKEGVFNFKENIVVLDPSSKQEKVVDLVADGFPISVVSINNDFDKDLMDVALIKIEQKNLPALPFGQASLFKVGEKIGVFGFPSTAELNNKNLLVSTFSQGVISAIRDSENKEFSMIQTDAKISEGSSGGPLLNERGEVIGMITYQSNILEGSGGDNFAFAIPIDVVQNGVKKFNITNNDIDFGSGNYNTEFSKGLRLLHESQCKKALLSFEKTKDTNDKFNASINIEPYKKKCQDLIVAGKSIDTRWDKAKQMLLSLEYWVWGVVAALLLIIIAIAIKLFMMKKRLEKDEKEIVFLEEEIKENDSRDLEEMKEIKKIEKELAELKNNKK